MAGRVTLRRRMDALYTKYSAQIRDALMASARDVRSRVVLRRVIAALESGDVGGAVDAMNIERAAFAPLERALADAYSAAGAAVLESAPFTRIVVRFDARNLRAERWVSDYSSRLITGIVEEQRATIRSILQAGLSAGRNPNSVALDIVGRIDRATGRRSGGIIGLSEPQSRYVSTARAELTSGDPALMRNYLERGRRDVRFDRTVQRAISDGTTIDTATVNKIIGRYSDNLLLLRGQTIGRTEALTALHEGKHEGFRQGLARTNYTTNDVMRIWRSAGDGRVRHTHAEMDGQEVTGLETPFTSPSGAQLKFPGDRSLGAPASETINCRCDVDYRIDFSAGVT